MPHKRWRVALTIIYSCRALAKKHLSGVVLRSPSFVAIDVRDAAGADPDPLISLAATSSSSFACLVKEKQFGSLHRLGGAAGIAAALSSDAEHGIVGDPNDLRRRREAFGANTYPKPKPRSFFSHVVDALSDVFLLVLVACAAISLGFGIKEHGIKSGWYDGASIFLAVFLVVAVSAFSNHRQSKRFERLASECDNIDVSVVRDGRRSEVSIFDIVVGDVVILKIGDQVPADGVFLAGHSVQLDESSVGAIRRRRAHRTGWCRAGDSAARSPGLRPSSGSCLVSVWFSFSLVLTCPCTFRSAGRRWRRAYRRGRVERGTTHTRWVHSRGLWE